MKIRYRFWYCWSLLLGTYAFAAPSEWQLVAPGLEYRATAMPQITPFSKLHAFRIDLKYYEFDLVFARERAAARAFVADLAQHKKALIAINGGFFSSDYEPIGLRVRHNKQEVPLKNISWWGVFFIQNHTPHIVAAKQYQANHDISFAIQAGPRLIIDKAIPTLKAGFAQRSAIGIDKQARVILIATEHAAMSTTELANLLKSPDSAGGFNCVNALNLDGGSSTQIYSNIPNLQLNTAKFSPVTDAIVIHTKARHGHLLDSP